MSIKSVVLKFILVVVVLAVLYVGGWFFYWWITYIDKTVTKGEAYGFKIGQTKEEVYAAARDVFAGKSVYILYPLDHQDHGPHKEIKFLDSEYNLIADRDSWEIYYNQTYFNTLWLSFENDSLIEIYRHRKNFELP